MRHRQIAHRLRLQMGPGRPHIESERPRNKKTGRYTDLDANGQSTTVIDIPDGTLDDVGRLLRQGAIQELPAAPAPPAAPTPTATARGVPDGEDPS